MLYYASFTRPNNHNWALLFECKDKDAEALRRIKQKAVFLAPAEEVEKLDPEVVKERMFHLALPEVAVFTHQAVNDWIDWCCPSLGKLGEAIACWPNKLNDQYYEDLYRKENHKRPQKQQKDVKVDQSPLSATELEALVILVECGPVWAGDFPDSNVRYRLIARGYATATVVKMQEGYTVATPAGRDAYIRHFSTSEEDKQNITLKEAYANRMAKVMMNSLAKKR